MPGPRRPIASRSPTPLVGYDDEGKPVTQRHQGPEKSVEELSPIQKVAPTARELRLLARIDKLSDSSQDTQYPVGSPASVTSIGDFGERTQGEQDFFLGQTPPTPTLVDATVNLHDNTVDYSSDNDEFHELDAQSPDTSTTPEGSIITTILQPSSPDKPDIPDRATDTVGKQQQLANMSVPDAVRDIMRRASSARITWEDSIKGADATKLPNAVLTNLLSKAEELRDTLSDVSVSLEIDYPDYATHAVFVTSKAAKEDIKTFIQAAYIAQRVRELAADDAEKEKQRDPAKEVKKSRVDARKHQALDELDALANELKTLALVTPDSDPAYLMHADNVTETKQKANDAIADVEKLLNDAIDAGMEQDVLAFDQHISSVRGEISNVNNALKDAKQRFGVLTTMGHRPISDVPPPTFSGGSDPDYFTFCHNWSQYLASKHLTEAEKVRVLLHKCLKGTALNVSKCYKETGEIFEALQKTFGNPRLLFQTKIEELKTLGNCAGSDVSKRAWIVDVRARLDIIYKLAKDHDLLEALHLNQVVGMVEGMITPKMARNFKELVKKDDKSGNMPADQAWVKLCKCLDESVDFYTFEINHALNRGASLIDKPRDRPVKSDKFKVKSGNPTQQTNTLQQTNQLIHVNNAQPANANSKTVLRGDGKSANSGKKGKARTDKTDCVISAAYTSPVEHTCAPCGGQHTHAYYCKEFIAAKEKERVSIVARMRACFRCLRVDAQQVRDSAKRDEWFSKHRVNCNDQHICKEGKCAKMTGRMQWHFLLCCYHTTENKQYEKDFIKQLDSAKVPPGVSFLFNFPDMAFQLAAPPLSANPVTNKDVLSDVAAPSIFMLQNIEVKGQSLLCFYDSGCGGAAVQSRAADLLDSVTVRDGPTVLHVAGGRSLRIEGGDERFHLKLHNSDKKATLTGLKMDSITVKFPLWKIGSAWPDILKDIMNSDYKDVTLPKYPDKIGGDQVHIMIGIRYLMYYPKLLFMLPCGLGVYQSQFAAPRDEVLVLGGPHPVWEHCAENANLVGPHCFFSAQYRAFQNSCSTVRHVFPEIQHVPFDRIAEYQDPCDLVGVMEGNVLRGGGGVDLWEPGDVQVGEAGHETVNTLVQPESSNSGRTDRYYHDQSFSYPAATDYSDRGWLSWIDTMLTDIDSSVDQCEEVDCAETNNQNSSLLAELSNVTEELINDREEAMLLIDMCSEKEPDTSAPDPTEPHFSQPDVRQPDFSDPNPTDPDIRQPGFSDPEPTDPDLRRPDFSEPNPTNPDIRQPDFSDPDDAELEPVGALHTALTESNLHTSGTFCPNTIDHELLPDYDFLFDDELIDAGDDGVLHEDSTVICGGVHCEIHASSIDFVIPPSWNAERTVYSLKDATNRYLEGELSASEVTYRCIKCRNCNDCRNSGKYEAVSLREEHEQYLIEESVTFDPVVKKLIATLPFIKDPAEHLFKNKYGANKVFESQMLLVGRCDKMRQDVLTSFKKLADKKYFLPVSELPADKMKEVTDQLEGTYVIPWRVVFKEGSLSTPCRMVFDASARTPGGLSLNECLAKGENNLVKIHDILLRFRNKPAAFSTDIRQAYNQLQLDPSCYRYQKFLWKEDLIATNPTVEYIIATLIYGVRPSGNQTQAGFGKVADYALEHFPEHADGAHALKDSCYVDDVLKSDVSDAAARSTAASLDFTLKLAGMEVKSYTYSNEKPAEDVSADGVHIGVVGLNWDSERDLLGIDVKPLYFGRTKRGKLPELVTGEILPALKRNFTRRNLLSKVAGVFDPLGLVTPITSRFKLQLHSLIELQLGWDEKVPDSYLEDWMQSINDMQDLKNLRFKRAVIPQDAASLDMDLIISCDSSKDIAIATVHARSLLRSGRYHTQLVTAKSKLVSELTIPKAELRGAVLAVHLGHAVKRSLGDQFKRGIYVTDSSIALFWIMQDERPLEVMVRNCVIEIRRFSATTSWFHVPTDCNIADLGTRFASVSDIGMGSVWQDGPEWMRYEYSDMPIKTVEQVKMDGEQKRIAYQATAPPDICGIQLPFLRDKVSERYAFSKYIVDPNKYSWFKAVKVVGLIFRFIRKIQTSMVKRTKPFTKIIDREWFPVKTSIVDRTVHWVRDKPALSTYEQRIAENYFFALATQEAIKFSSKKDLVHTDKRNGILYYTGRILQGQEILSPQKVMFDLPPLSFVRPVLDRFSPVAYSIMVHCHTEVVHHRSALATLRSSRDYAYVFRGRDLAIEVRENCRSCTRFKRQLLEVEMGKVHETRLTVAPAFYVAQVDLFGPMDARCPHNHRSSIKVYGVVFKCPSTCAVAVYVMPSYGTEDFIAAYTRFSSRYGHPSKLHIDQGTQLLAACRKMEISITDLANNLAKSYGVGVEYEACAVQGHQAQGMVERSIKTIKTLFERVYKGLKMDALAYETAFSWIASQLNNLPICLGSRTENLDYTDLITPARLLLGRASNRALDGHVRIESPSKVIAQMDLIFNSWYEAWQLEKLADFIPKPLHWKDGNVDAQEGDIVLMLLSEKEKKVGSSVWRLGRIRTLEMSVDGITRTATLEYKNDGEKVFRTTIRALGSVAVIHREDQLDLIQELNKSAKEANISFIMSQ